MILAVLLAAAASPSDPLPPALAGTWRATLASPGGELPFGLVLSTGGPSATIENGAESVPVAGVRFEKGELVLPFAHYDAELRATPSADARTLTGSWTKRGRDGTTTLAWRAEIGAAPRFEREAAPAPAEVAGRWRVRFEGSEHDAVGVFEASGDALTGTFLTATGDQRYLAGSFEGDHLRLSGFDGGHALLFDARLKDGALAGVRFSGSSQPARWSATRDAEVKAPDGWSLATWDASFPLGLLTFPDLSGNPRSLAEWLAGGKGLVLAIGGTWCANCQDELRDLAQLDRKLRASGVAIVGLSFEHSTELARAAELVRRSMIRAQAAYPILLAGSSDPELAAQALPPLAGTRGFPTTVFVRRDGTVRAVHVGYSGPATGAAHAALVAEFERLGRELAEDPPPPTVWPRIASGRWVDEPNGFLTTIFGNERDGRYQSNDPEFEADMQRVAGQLSLRVQAAALLFEDHPFHLELESQSMLDPFDFGHRLIAEQPPTAETLKHVDANGFAVSTPAWPVAPERIADALRGSDARLRRAALYASVRATHEGKIAPVDPTPFLADPDVLVRCQAAWVAGALHASASVPQLVANAAHGFAPLRRECAHALGRLRAKEGREVLERLTRDLDPLVARHARAALVELAR